MTQATMMATAWMDALAAMQIDYKYRPVSDTLRVFHLDRRSRARVIVGPLGSGKTTAALVEVLRLIDEQAPNMSAIRSSRVAIVRNTSVDLKSSTLKDWREVVPPELGAPGGTSPITHVIEYGHADGKTRVRSEVMFLGFDELRDVRKIRGLQLTWLFIDEAKELHKAIVDMLMARTGRFPRKWTLKGGADLRHGTVMTTNAFDQDHWLYRIMASKPPGWKFYIQPPGLVRDGDTWRTNTTADNLTNLPDGYYVNQVPGKREDWIRVNLANEFVYASTGRAVHPHFSQSLHVADVDLEPQAGNNTLLVGVDWGRTPAMVFAQYDAARDQYRVLDELVMDNASAHGLGVAAARRIASRYSDLAVMGWGDPAGKAQAQTRDEDCFSILAEAGIEIEPVQTNDFDVRTSALDAVLTRLNEGRPAILISPRCQTIIRGLAGAYYLRRVSIGASEIYADKPVKTPESHVCEALHYLLVGAGEATSLAGATALDVPQDEIVDWFPPQDAFA